MYNDDLQLYKDCIRQPNYHFSYEKNLSLALTNKANKIFKYTVETGFAKGKELNLNAKLTTAVCNGNFEIVKFLCELPEYYGVNPFANYTAFLCAVRYDNLKIVKFLCELPIDRAMNPAENNNEAIILAIKNGHIDIVKYLKKFKDVDATLDLNKATILASEYQHPKVVKFLLMSQGVKEKEIDNLELATNHDNLMNYMNNQLRPIDIPLLETLRENAPIEVVGNLLYLFLDNAPDEKVQQHFQNKIFAYK